jgi:hypothetical protein
MPTKTLLPFRQCARFYQKMTTSISRAASSAKRLRTKIPFCAADEVLIATTKGTANPNAWGQAMTQDSNDTLLM